MTEILTSQRTEGMVDASADYYQESKIFHDIQNSQALEYDRVYDADLDLDLQLSPYTATWGLVYWEIAVGIPPNPVGDYDARRPLILAKLINESNFGADTIKTLAENYGEKIDVIIDPRSYTVYVSFYEGIPPFINEFRSTLENLIHAHLSLEYRFMYQNYGNLYIGSRHTVAPTIVVHPYLLGDYSVTAKVTVGVRVKTGYIFKIGNREE